VIQDMLLGMSKKNQGGMELNGTYQFLVPAGMLAYSMKTNTRKKNT
jgi:hypothetical protein